LILLGYIDGDKETEKQLHRRFDRVNLEFFKPTDSLVCFINENSKLINNYVSFENEQLMLYKRMKVVN